MNLLPKRILFDKLMRILRSVDHGNRPIMSQDLENSHSPTINPEEWVDHYGDHLFHVALERLRDAEEAGTIVEKTFLAALNHLQGEPRPPKAGFAKGDQGRAALNHLQSKSSPTQNSPERPWLVEILKGQIINRLREKYREKPAANLQENEEAIDSFFDLSNHFKKQPSGWFPRSEKLLKDHEFCKVFQKCLEKLPQATRDAFILKDMENVDSQTICEILNITPLNLEVMLNRSRLQIRQGLEINWFENTRNL